MKKIILLAIASLGVLCIAGPAMAAGGNDSYSGNKEDPFQPVYDLIEQENYSEAHQLLLEQSSPKREADRMNLLGFTARKAGNYPDAARYYEEALAIDPEHLGALEYQGELFITLGHLDKARDNLAKIDDICWFACDEEKQLRQAIEAAQTN